MKKLFLAVMAVATIAMVGCKKGGNEPVGPVGPGGGGDDEPAQTEEAPEVAAPGDGKVTIVIQIPEGTECHGIAFKGTLDDAAWSGENTYVGEGKPDASKDECIKFEKVANTKTWWKATYTLGSIGLKGKICLIYTGDKDWQGQAVKVALVDSYTTADVTMADNIEIASQGLAYFTIGGWQTSECVTPVDYKLTFIVPAFCDGEFEMEVVGSFDSWGGSPVALAKVEGNKFAATIKATPNAELKIRGKGGWDKEIQQYHAEGDEWKGCDNVVLGTSTDVTTDYSDAEKYRWSHCAE